MTAGSAERDEARHGATERDVGWGHGEAMGGGGVCRAKPVGASFKLLDNRAEVCKGRAQSGVVVSDVPQHSFAVFYFHSNAVRHILTHHFPRKYQQAIEDRYQSRRHTQHIYRHVICFLRRDNALVRNVRLSLGLSLSYD